MELARPSEAVSLGWEATEFQRLLTGRDDGSRGVAAWPRGRPRDDPSIGP
jgi:hypothetical protein